MQKRYQKQLQKYAAAIFLSLGVVGILLVFYEQILQYGSQFVVKNPLLSALMLPAALLLYALIYIELKNIGDSHHQSRILLLRDDSILSEGLISLLHQQQNVIVSTITVINMDLLLAEMDVFQPHAVILPDQDTIFVKLLDLFDMYPSLHSIIRVKTENEQIRVYEKNQIVIQHIDDFSSVIKRQGIFTSLNKNSIISNKSSDRVNMLRRD